MGVRCEKASLVSARVAPAAMMHGHEKSDLVIVAMKPANKAKKALCGGICGGGRSGVGGAKGGGQGEYAPAKHVLDSAPGSRDTGAGAYTATICRHTPEVGAVCGRAARTDLGGGRAMKRTSLPLQKRTFITLPAAGGIAGRAWRESRKAASPPRRPWSTRADPHGDQPEVRGQTRSFGAECLRGPCR